MNETENDNNIIIVKFIQKNMVTKNDCKIIFLLTLNNTHTGTKIKKN